MAKKENELKYIKEEQSGADKIMRWNLCQEVSRRLYRGTMSIQKIKEILEKAEEREKEITIKINK